MNVATARLCLQLHGLSTIGDSSLTRLLLHCGSPEALAEGGTRLWRELNLPPGAVQEMGRALGGGGPVDIDAQLESLARVGADILPVSDPCYPPLLRAIHDPPPMLYVRGDRTALSAAQLAIVGSRKASPAGIRAAGALAGQAVQAGLRVTSGLALGIDVAAHRGALDRGGGSVAVMATGVDRIYPARHRELAQPLTRTGCLVSEFPPGMLPLKHNFPRRNRIISGLSLGVLVVEAALPSGSLITARTALEQGREVFTLPWSIYHTGGAGCLQLLRDGAKMVETIRDVLEELGSIYTLQQDLRPEQEPEHPRLADLSPGQQEVLALVGFEAVPVDELIEISGLPVSRVMAELSFLETQGLITRAAGGYLRT